MDILPRQSSPQWTPRPLQPSPWNTPKVSPRSVTPPDDLPDDSQIPSLYLSTVAPPMQDPYDIIHDFYNVSPVPVPFELDGRIPRTVEMPLVHRTESRPTHVLAIFSSANQSSSTTNTSTSTSTPGPSYLLPRDASSPSVPPSPHPSTPSSPQSPDDSEPFLLPIDATHFAARFGHNIARTLTAGPFIRPARPLVRWDRASGTHLITLPLIPLHVPHPPSIPHLLLFGQGLGFPLPLPSSPRSRPHPPVPGPAQPIPIPIPSPSPGANSSTSTSTLATYLLPVRAIEEFPAAPAMAEVMARGCSDAGLRARVAFNQGLWRNILLLAPVDAGLVDLARLAWNVTADARRMQRQHLQIPASALTLRRASRSRSRSRSRSPSPSPDPSPSRVRSCSRTGERSERSFRLPEVQVQYAEESPSTTLTTRLAPVPPARKSGQRRNGRNDLQV